MHLILETRRYIKCSTQHGKYIRVWCQLPRWCQSFFYIFLFAICTKVTSCYIYIYLCFCFSTHPFHHTGSLSLMSDLSDREMRARVRRKLGNQVIHAWLASTPRVRHPVHVSHAHSMSDISCVDGCAVPGMMRTPTRRRSAGHQASFVSSGVWSLGSSSDMEGRRS